VDAQDRPIGTLDKHQAHRDGVLHRAFSVFIFNARGELLLQRRSATKYHSGGLWTNTCCSHPRPDEPVAGAAARRLEEEMGIACPLQKAFEFVYRAEVVGGLVEHEFDHVFLGHFDGRIRPDPAEVMDTRWLAPAALRERLREARHDYTPWFHLSIEQVLTLI
jgi:isopentenyl-diphosphate delta-isomerase